MSLKTWSGTNMQILHFTNCGLLGQVPSFKPQIPSFELFSL